jgi:hypothetical protein
VEGEIESHRAAMVGKAALPSLLSMRTDFNELEPDL